MTRQTVEPRVASAALKAALRGHEPSAEQWDAITAPLEPQCIIAGAGSGKTAVMTARIVWLVEQGMVRPSGVLGLTFTNKAASELEQRLTEAMALMRPRPSEAPAVTTYNAFGAQIVRDHGARIGVRPEAALLSKAQKWQLLQSIVNDLPRRLEHIEMRHPLSFIPQTLELADQCASHRVPVDVLIAECERLVQVLSDPYQQEAARKRSEFCLILRAYLQAKRDAGRIDYGDQIGLAVDLLTGFPAVAGELRDAHPVVLLDEYQDTDPAQKKMLQALCPPGSAVTAVGDARQAIYAWRGASMFNLIGFPGDFPRADGADCRVMSLAANYRSGRRIVHVANEIISPVDPVRRPGADLVAVPQRGEGSVTAGLFADQDAEAAFIADRIEEIHAAGQTRWREMAILVRTRRFMDAIVRVLEGRDIPVEIPDLAGLMKTPPVLDTVAWMRVLDDTKPDTNRWAARILMGPRFRVHYRDLAPVARWAAERTSALRGERAPGVIEADPGEVAFSLMDALRSVHEIDGVSGEARTRIAEFLELRDALRPCVTRPLIELAQIVIDRTGIADTLAASPARSAPAALRTLETFLAVCGDFTPIEGEAGLGTFLDYLDAVDESDDTIALASSAPSDSVKLMTVHSAKGLEFEVVFLPVLAASQDVNYDGWRKHSVFPDVRASDPFNSPKALPNTIRDDRAHLPDPNDYRKKTDYKAALRERALEDERRLMYVAVTRAKRALYCTAAWWYGSDDCRGPSIFWDEVAAHDVVDVAERCEAPAENPVVERMSHALTWPPGPRLGDEAAAWLDRAAAIAAGDATSETVLGTLPAVEQTEARDLLDAHLRLIESLARPESPEAAPGPGSLSVTALAALLAGRTTRTDIDVPLPERPTQARRIGIEVHAWIEELGRGLLGLADEEALDEASTLPDRQTVRRLQEAFASQGWAQRRLATLDTGEPMSEVPFVLKLAGRLVRGRVDAVYETDAGGLEVVDYKTGVRPEHIDWGQLEIYAEALAELGLARGPVTITYAYLASGDNESREYTPAGLDALDARAAAALGAG